MKTGCEIFVVFGEMSGIIGHEIQRYKIESNQRLRLMLGQKNEQGKELL